MGTLAACREALRAALRDGLIGRRAGDAALKALFSASRAMIRTLA
jgi:hypothetical protein